LARKRLVALYKGTDRKYEVAVILKQTLSMEAVKTKMDQLQSIAEELGSKIESKSYTGLKSFAYPIESKNNTRGYFGCLYISTSAEKINEIRRKISLEDDVLRTLIIIHNPAKTFNGIFGSNYEDESEKKRKSISYDDPNYISRFIGERAKIEPKKQNLGRRVQRGTSLRQRKISREIKRARYFNLIAYVSD
jgi:ribosomal protein S6/ribosomal protein S18